MHQWKKEVARLLKSSKPYFLNFTQNAIQYLTPIEFPIALLNPTYNSSRKMTIDKSQTFPTEFKKKTCYNVVSFNLNQ